MMDDNDMPFIGRKYEMDMLNQRYNSNQAEFFLLYGRRRVGKTELLMQFCEDKPSIYYYCDETTDEAQLSVLSQTILSFEHDKVHYGATFATWADAFMAVGDLCGDKKLVFVLDEFPYIVKNNKSILSVLQKLWDLELCHKNIMIVITGSTMSFIKKKLLSQENPLFGRIDGHYKLEPLPFSDAIQFFQDYSDEDKIIAYSILGGTPYYLKKFNPKWTIAQNIENVILKKDASLYDMVNTVLREELREPSVFNRIIEVIAQGETVFNNIKNKTKLSTQKLSVYLSRLIELGIIVKDYSFDISETDKTNETVGKYYLADNFFRFWYRYAFPNKKLLEQRKTGKVMDIIKTDAGGIHSYASKAFETACIDYINEMDRRGKLPFGVLYVGRYWGKIKEIVDGKPKTSPVEIDLVANGEEQNQYILGECKFKNELLGEDELKSLRAKCTFKGEIYYYLFSLAGFTKGIEEIAQRDHHVVLVTAHDVVNCIQDNPV
ncbi:MAG: ATP-binding protein [Clostridia bacterium]|nr:ATP-binding protein [Clostridia bacterium]